MEIMAVYPEVQKKDIKKLRGQNCVTNFKADFALSNHWASKVENIQEEINFLKSLGKKQMRPFRPSGQFPYVTTSVSPYFKTQLYSW